MSISMCCFVSIVKFMYRSLLIMMYVLEIVIVPLRISFV